MNAEWRWDFTFEILPKMLWATLNTIMAAGIGYSIAAIVGLIFLLGQQTPYKLINIAVREIVEFIRSTPLLIQLFFVYFVGPTIWYYIVSLDVSNDYNRVTLWNIPF